jgi:alcohol dehydrogenase class IV
VKLRDWGGSMIFLISDENLVKLDFIRDTINSIDKMGIETPIYSTNIAESTIDVAEDIAVYVRKEGRNAGKNG